MMRIRSNSLRVRAGLTAVMLSVVSLLAMGCSDDDVTPMAGSTTTFEVSIENISDAFVHALAGVFNTPEGMSMPGAIGPGMAYTFRFGAVPGQKLSFATMFVHSNDVFFAPTGAGIALYDTGGMPVSGDVTSQVQLWDAGTEINQEPGLGADQPPRQGAANTGAADANTSVRLLNDGFTYPAVSAVIRVTITPEAGNEFTVRIENVSTGTTLMTSMGDMLAVPMAPGTWVVHTADNPLFVDGMVDSGMGLEALAEDGDPATLGMSKEAQSGLQGPLAPGVWAVHSMTAPLFDAGAVDRGDGLEALAEDGDPAALAAATSGQAGVLSSGVFNTPVGAGGPGPAMPGGAYQFTFTASDGEYLSFATMLVQTNDLFFAPGTMGIPLFNSGTPVQGDVTAQVQLWDAGTEENQFPGAGPDQAPRQAAANTGAADATAMVRLVADAFAYPPTNALVRVTITPMP